MGSWRSCYVHPLRNVSLQALNTLALPAHAAALINVNNDRELGEAISWAAAEGLPVMPLGDGSNVVLSPGVSALVLRQSSRAVQLLQQTPESVVLRAFAGQNWHALVEWTLAEGFYGLENLALIPGTVGAAPIQNIGAYGVELAAFVEAVHVRYLAGGESAELSSQACRFGYRDSVFKHGLRDEVVITAVDLRLSRRPEPNVSYPALAGYLKKTNVAAVTPAQLFHAVVAIRRSKLPDPAQLPNAGSFFKNPVVSPEQAHQLGLRFADLPRYQQGDGSVKLPAAWLIEHCGWKGYRSGSVGVHPQHALVLINYGGGDASDLLALAGKIVESVREQFELSLDIEPRVYGEVA